MLPTKPRLISVIVPAFNEEKLLAGVLANLQEAMGGLRDANWQTELIVCDNNSRDKTAEIARQAGARVVFEPVNQIARARNKGASVAQGEWMIFVDADSWPCRQLFGEIAKAIASNKFVGGGAILRFDAEFWWSNLFLRLWNRLSRFRGWAAGSLVFCDAIAFKEVGGFNEELFVSEEIDLSNRLAGWGGSRGRKMTILTRFPMKTSARKMRLYTWKEHLLFFGKSALNLGKSARRKEDCPIWYDGRR